MVVLHSPMQARLAYRCALVLRDLIHPYLLRRQKKDLKDIIRLTAKTEQVRHQRIALAVRQQSSGRPQVFCGSR